MWSLNYGYEHKYLSASPKQGVITYILKEGKAKHYLKNAQSLKC